MQLTPPPPPPPTPTPTSIRTRFGRVVKSRHVWSYPSNQVCLHPPRDFSHSDLRVQVRDQRIDREFAVGWRGINAQFPRESPAPPMSTPVPPLPTHARAHMTIDEIFETQRLRDKLRKASDEAHAAELTAFMNTNIVPIIRELNDTRARCSALEQHLKRARTSLAGHVVSASPFQTLSHARTWKYADQLSGSAYCHMHSSHQCKPAQHCKMRASSCAGISNLVML